VRKLFALVLTLVAGLAVAGTASACDHGTNVTVVRGGYNTVGVVKAVNCDNAVALTNDYVGNVAIANGYGGNVTIVRKSRFVQLADTYDYGYNRNVEVVRVVKDRNVKVVKVRAENQNDGGGILGILKAAGKTVRNVGRAVVGG
jgi:hypothetical protein